MRIMIYDDGGNVAVVENVGAYVIVADNAGDGRSASMLAKGSEFDIGRMVGLSLATARKKLGTAAFEAIVEWAKEDRDSFTFKDLSPERPA